MNKKYELVHEVGSTVNVPVEAQLHGIDKVNDVCLEYEDVIFWIGTKKALELGLIKEVVRKPQVGDVYKDSDGFVREIVAVNKVHVWYFVVCPSGRTVPNGGVIEVIEDWGELQCGLSRED